MIGKSFKVSFILILLLGFIFLSIDHDNVGLKPFTKVVKDLSLEDALLKMGDQKQVHYIDKLHPDSVRFGYEMITLGQIQDGNHKRISKFFVCTDCHNLTAEVYDLADESPEARIKYGMDKKMPYLPASTFHGLYNKVQWYNGDYSLKYGDLVKPTRDTLVNAIQLCAVQCSQGRPLEHWEIRSILHYYKSIGIQIRDLNLSSNELDRLTTYVVNKDKTGIKLLKQKYTERNPATFGELKKPSIEGYSPDLKKGQYLFENACLHCHKIGKGITNFEFDASQLTLSFFETRLRKSNHFSVPYIVRKGTYAITGKKQYMPQYTLEKMSEKQMLDLLAYIGGNEK